jgi:hypothetical protein
MGRRGDFARGPRLRAGDALAQGKTAFINVIPSKPGYPGAAEGSPTIFSMSTISETGRDMIKTVIKRGLLILGLRVSFSVLALAALLLGFLFFERGEMSQIRDTVAVKSPDNRYIATGFHVIGSATVHNSTVIQIRTNAFLRKGDPVFIVDDLGAFNISWARKDELTVTYTTGPIYLQNFDWHGITIKYIQK